MSNETTTKVIQRSSQACQASQLLAASRKKQSSIDDRDLYHYYDTLAL
jgi:hypothetical protein